MLNTSCECKGRLNVPLDFATASCKKICRGCRIYANWRLRHFRDIFLFFQECLICRASLKCTYSRLCAIAWKTLQFVSTMWRHSRWYIYLERLYQDNVRGHPARCAWDAASSAFQGWWFVPRFLCPRSGYVSYLICHRGIRSHKSKQLSCLHLIWNLCIIGLVSHGRLT